ncbi:MAG: class I SAM-dependent RNA methyltransferase [Oligoflexus sp.]
MNKLPSKIQVNDVFTLCIERMSYGGKGIGFYEGKAIFVPQTVPGDVVEVILEKDKKRFAEARIVTFQEYSDLRQKAPCRWMEECGGCQWQMVHPDQQLSWKKSFVLDALRRIGKLDHIPEIIMYPAPHIFHYRNRIQLKGQYLRHGKVQIGYYAQGSHHLVNIDHCLVAQEPINKLIQQLGSSDFAKIPADQQFYCAVQVVSIDGQDGLLVELHPATGKAPVANSMATIKEAIEALDISSFVLTTKNITQEFWPYDIQDGLVYWTAAGQFQQVHLSGNQLLRSHVRKLCQAAQAKKVLDLFCGSGNLSLQLAAFENCEVLGLEINPIAIKTAQQNIKCNAIKNASYRTAASRQLTQHIGKDSKFDLILVDPPRAGLEEAIEPLIQAKANNIVYVSCDPNTLARDLARLTAAGYTVEKISCFDFFPHTYHIETVVSLRLH